MFLQQGKPLWQKVWLFKRTAKINGSAGCVFVMDSEGKPNVVQADLEKGRDHMHPDFPMAIGVAHTCVEAWLLSDASAIRRGLSLNQRPTVPPNPESLPAPQANRNHNPKTVLAACHPNNRHPNLVEKTAMAEQLSLATAEAVCPSFCAFAAEVRQRIRLLFPPPPPAVDDTQANAEPTEPPASDEVSG
jgi:hypothetical protein